jgi:predicted transcriptional regulator
MHSNYTKKILRKDDLPINILPDLSDLKNIRKSLGLSQEELGDKLNIPQSTISRIEKGKMDPPYSKFKKIFEFLERERMQRKQTENQASDIMTRTIYSVDSKSTIKEAIELMNTYNISQVPIIEKNGQNLGSLSIKKIQKLIIEHPELLNADVMTIKELAFPEVEKGWSVKDISKLLGSYPAVLVRDHQRYIGIITDSDFLKLTNQ